ncbi:phosphoglycerate mutase [Deltaproteobacteria bacterium]|nr:phosphoglycerate mutase [Deltaproteobacteria bacterium]
MFDAATQRILPSSRLAHLHLYRHGEVETGVARVCRGQLDVALSDRGREQTFTAVQRFLTMHGAPNRVLTSDLHRCRAMAEQFGVQPELLPGLREQDMGDWEGRTWESLTEADGPAVTAYWADYVNARPTGGESWAAACERVVATWGALGPLQGRIVVCTHVGPIRALLCSWLGLPPGEGLRFAPGYATETRVLLAEAGAVLEAMGA